MNQLFDNPIFLFVGIVVCIVLAFGLSALIKRNLREAAMELALALVLAVLGIFMDHAVDINQPSPPDREIKLTLHDVTLSETYDTDHSFVVAFDIQNPDSQPVADLCIQAYWPENYQSVVDEKSSAFQKPLCDDTVVGAHLELEAETEYMFRAVVHTENGKEFDSGYYTTNTPAAPGEQPESSLTLELSDFRAGENGVVNPSFLVRNPELNQIDAFGYSCVPHDGGEPISYESEIDEDTFTEPEFIYVSSAELKPDRDYEVNFWVNTVENGKFFVRYDHVIPAHWQLS